jgi:hypothetical protein
MGQGTGADRTSSIYRVKLVPRQTLKQAPFVTSHILVKKVVIPTKTRIAKLWLRKHGDLIACSRQFQCFQDVAASPLGVARVKVFETARRMSLVLSTSGDTVGAVIDNEATGNR